MEAVRTKSSIRAGDDNSSRDTRLLALAPPCQDWSDLTTVTVAAQVRGNITACQCQEDVQDIFKAFDSAKKPIVSLLQACKTACRDLESAIAAEEKQKKKREEQGKKKDDKKKKNEDKADAAQKVKACRYTAIVSGLLTMSTTQCGCQLTSLKCLPLCCTAVVSGLLNSSTSQYVANSHQSGVCHRVAETTCLCESLAGSGNAANCHEAD